MLSFIIFIFCFTFGVTILALWIINVVKSSETKRENEAKIKRCISRMEDYTSYKICSNSSILFLNDKTGHITYVYALTDCSPFEMKDIEGIETKVVKGSTIEHYRTRTVVKTDGSNLGNIIKGAATLNAFGFAILSSPQKRIEKETVKHTFETDDKYYVSIRYHVGRITDTLDVQTLDEKEMNEVADYLKKFVADYRAKNSDPEEEEEYF